MKIGKTLIVALFAVIVVLGLLPAMAMGAELEPRQLVAMISDKPMFVEAEPEYSPILEDAPIADEDEAVGDEPEAGNSASSETEAGNSASSEAGEQEAERREDPPKKIGIVTLNSGNLNVRNGPSLEDEIIGKLPNGAVVDVLEPLEEWVKIPYNGSVAYVSKPYLVIRDAGETGRKVIVLDPGHGGKDPGAIAKDGTYESNLVYGYTLEAKKALEQAGYTVLLTRGENTSCTDYQKQADELGCRAGFAAKTGGDIFISIHADSNPKPSFRGTATFYNARNDLDGNQNPFPAESRLLAKLIQEAVQPAIGSTDRGIADKNYFVNRMNSVPSVLIELACLSNSSDLKLLKSEKTKQKFAAALTKAVNQYFGISS